RHRTQRRDNAVHVWLVLLRGGQCNAVGLPDPVGECSRDGGSGCSTRDGEPQPLLVRSSHGRAPARLARSGPVPAKPGTDRNRRLFVRRPRSQPRIARMLALIVILSALPLAPSLAVTAASIQPSGLVAYLDRGNNLWVSQDSGAGAVQLTTAG